MNAKVIPIRRDTSPGDPAEPAPAPVEGEGPSPIGALPEGRADSTPRGADLGEENGLSDEALVAACGVGDRGALGALFRRHRAALHRFCERMLGDDPEDVVQTTFLIAWRDADRFRGRSSVRGWLLGIAANLVRRELRSRGHAGRAMADLRARPQPPSADPGREAEYRQLVGRLAAAVETLPVELREAFVLCSIEGIPGPEAARILGVRPGTLWRRLHDARKRLLPLVEDGEEEDEEVEEVGHPRDARRAPMDGGAALAPEGRVRTLRVPGDER